jgi:L-asparaginase
MKTAIFSRIGAISGKDMTAECAITKAMHLIDNPAYKEALPKISKSLCGEISD